jgi:lipid-binding SYLF domain-containing protein
MMCRIRITACMLAIIGLLPNLSGAWEPDPEDKLQIRAAAEVERLRVKYPQLQKYFDEAAAYAIYPGVGRLAFGFGAVFGRGVLIEDDQVIGTTNQWQVTIGFDFGAQLHSQIFFFQDDVILEELKGNTWEFQGRGSIVVIAVGASGDPGYKPEVAVFSRTKGGLQVEAAVGVGRFGYKPLQE